jgi:hypothetical protein
MSPEELVILQRTFSNTLMIANKERVTVPFNLNEHQMTYFAQQTGRDIILKSRQLGFSRALLGQKILKCMSKPNINTVIISHDATSTIKLFTQVHFYLKYAKIPIETGRKSTTEISFPSTDSTFYIGTAGAREFGRGDTITDLHCSELAFWENPERILVGLMQALTPTSQVTIESTANGVGNDFHRRCESARKRKGEFVLHFYPWYIAEEYSKVPLEGFSLTNDEEKYRERVYETVNVFLSDGQMYWRRCKIVDDLSQNKLLGITAEQFFDQEYPYDFDSAFLQSGTGVFTNLGLQVSPLSSSNPSLPSSPIFTDNLITFRPPLLGHDYTMGVDPAEGLRLDESIIEVVDANTREQVAEWASDTTPPDELAYVVAELGIKYNNAFAVVERNNHGLTTLSFLKHIYPMSSIYVQRRFGDKEWLDTEQFMLGLRTSSNKAKIIDELRRVLKEGFIIYNQDTIDELLSYIEVRGKGNNVKYQASSGCMDNRVMALALSVQGLSTMYRTTPATPKVIHPEMCIAKVVERLRARTKSKYGMPSLKDSYMENYCERI